MGADVDARFVTEDRDVVPAVTAERMRDIDRIATEETGPNLFQMMENAGRTLASQTIALLGAGWRGARVVVLAGGGGNSGGGICAARHLANRNVSVALVLSEPGRLGEVPTFQRTIFGSTRGHEIDATEVTRERPDLIVDAPTLTLALPKTGLVMGTAGNLWLADLGIPHATYERAGVDCTEPFGACDRVRLSLSPTPNDRPPSERV
jgi:NAD(P)H-hydrate epimerase